MVLEDLLFCWFKLWRGVKIDRVSMEHPKGKRMSKKSLGFYVRNVMFTDIQLDFKGITTW